VSNDQLKNLLIYIGVALANMVAIGVAAALAAGTMPGFRDGELLAPAKTEAVGLLAVVAPILSTWLASNRPRFGSEHLAAEVGAYKEMGYHRDDLTIRPKGGSVPDPGATDGSPVVLTPGQIKQVADELEARMRATPAESDPLISTPPAWLPGEGPGR
jgi:hypothetical protein